MWREDGRGHQAPDRPVATLLHRDNNRRGEGCGRDVAATEPQPEAQQQGRRHPAAGTLREDGGQHCQHSHPEPHQAIHQELPPRRGLPEGPFARRQMARGRTADHRGHRHAAEGVPLRVPVDLHRREDQQQDAGGSIRLPLPVARRAEIRHRFQASRRPLSRALHRQVLLPRHHRAPLAVVRSCQWHPG